MWVERVFMAGAPPSLTPAMFHILLTLVDGERHGYAIMQEVATRTSGATRIGPGTLYRSISHLLAAGWIAEANERGDPTINDERRRYYHLTDAGRQVAVAEAERLAEIVALARRKRLIVAVPALPAPVTKGEA